VPTKNVSLGRHKIVPVSAKRSASVLLRYKLEQDRLCHLPYNLLIFNAGENTGRKEDWPTLYVGHSCMILHCARAEQGIGLPAACRHNWQEPESCLLTGFTATATRFHDSLHNNYQPSHELTLAFMWQMTKRRWISTSTAQPCYSEINIDHSRFLAFYVARNSYKQVQTIQKSSSF
jgi:hypothetical protein